MTMNSSIISQKMIENCKKYKSSPWNHGFQSSNLVRHYGEYEIIWAVVLNVKELESRL
jgi:hypothetical protein